MSSSDTSTVNTSINSAEVYASLRIPDAIKFLPEYNGDSKLLSDFINSVEEILMLIRGTDQTPYGQFLLRSIKNKIVGKAKDVLTASEAGLNWDEIKEALILHCSDERDEHTLSIELHGLIHKQLSVQKLFDQIIDIKTLLFKLIDTKETDPNLARAKKFIFAGTCLNTFLMGMRGQLGGTIRAMKPTNLQEAYDWAIQERNIFLQGTQTNTNQRNNYQSRERYPQYNNRLQYNDRNSRRDEVRRYTNYNNRNYRYSGRNTERSNSSGRNREVPAIMPKQESTGRSSYPNTRSTARLHNIEENKQQERQENSQVHNIDEDSNFWDRASKSKQDT